MSESIQTQGKTVNDAVSEALLQLGLRRDEVEIKVIEEPKSGLLGFIGTRPAKVLVRKKPEGRRGRGRDRDNRSNDDAAHSLSGGRSRGGQRRSARSDKDGEGRQEGRRSGRDGGRGGRGRGGRGGQGRKPEGNEVRAESRGRSRGESANEPRKETPREDRGSARSENRNSGRNDNRSSGRSRRQRADKKPDTSQDTRAESREARTERPPVAERGEGQRSSRSRRGSRGRGRGRDRSAPAGREEQMTRSAQVASDLPAAEFSPEAANKQEPTPTKEKTNMTQDKTNQPPKSPPAAPDTPKTESATPAATAPETPTPVTKPKRKGWGGGLGSRLKGKANPAVKATPTKVVGETPAPSTSPSPAPTRRESRASSYDSNDYRDRRPSATADEVIVSEMPALKYAKVVTDVTEENLDAALSELTSGTLARAGFPCDVQVKEGEYRQVRIASDDESAGLLIGRHGQTVDAVEHLVERMASNAIDDRVRMNLDINDYRQRREETLRERVVEAIAEVRDSGKAYHVEPMSARERRLVHLEVEPIDGVRTYTMVGSGGKYVVIALDDEAGDDQNED